MQIAGTRSRGSTNNWKSPHYGITVSDLDEALDFHRDTLGLEIVSEGTIEQRSEDGEKFSKFVGVDNAEVDIVFLDAGGCQVE